MATPIVSPPIGLLGYLGAIKNVPTVGYKIAIFIEFLIKNHYIDGPEMIHLIGHSLGAHVSGVAGATIKSRLKKEINRRTGLDPAGIQIVLQVYLTLVNTCVLTVKQLRSFGPIIKTQN